jgi:hypothetical protein
MGHNCSINEFLIPEIVISGLNRETNRAFDLSFLEITGRQSENRISVKGCL